MKEIEAELYNRTIQDGTHITIALKTYKKDENINYYKVFTLENSQIIKESPIIGNKRIAKETFEEWKEKALSDEVQ